MWTWSQQQRGLFLQTSNMSEKSVGYTTIGGDMEGALSVIANVPKTVVNYLLEYLLERTGLRSHPPHVREGPVRRARRTTNVLSGISGSDAGCRILAKGCPHVDETRFSTVRRACCNDGYDGKVYPSTG